MKKLVSLILTVCFLIPSMSSSVSALGAELSKVPTTASTAIKLPAPTNLQWGVEYDMDGNAINKSGAMSWSFSGDCYVEFLVHLYTVDKKTGTSGLVGTDVSIGSSRSTNAVYVGDWNYPHKQLKIGGWVTLNELPAGDYYFTVQAFDPSGKYLDSSSVGSWTWKKSAGDDIKSYSFLNTKTPKPFGGFGEKANYQLSGDYLSVLKDNLSFVEEKHDSMLASLSWGGHCYGMSAVFALFNSHKLDISYFQQSAYKLSDLMAPKDSKKIFNLLTFYHRIQVQKNLNMYKYGMTLNKKNIMKQAIQRMKTDPSKYYVISARVKNDYTKSIISHALVVWNIQEHNNLYREQCSMKVWDPNRFDVYDMVYNEEKDTLYITNGDYIESLYGCASADDFPDLKVSLENLKYYHINHRIAIETSESNIEQENAYIISGYKNFSIQRGNDIAVIQDGKKIDGSLEISDAIPSSFDGDIDESLWYFVVPAQSENQNEQDIVTNSEQEIDSGITLTSLDESPTDRTIAFMCNSSGHDGFISTITSEKSPQCVEFGVDGQVDILFSEETNATITTTRNDATSPQYTTEFSGNMLDASVKPSQGCNIITTTKSTELSVATSNSLSTTNIGTVSVPDSGITVLSNPDNAQVIDNNTKEVIQETNYSSSVEFLTLGGTLIDPIVNIPPEGTIEAPETPEFEGYEFAGWYTSPDYLESEKWDFNTPISSSLTLYAKWDEKKKEPSPDNNHSGHHSSMPAQYTITFETNGGSAISKVTKNKGTTIDLAQYAPTKSGATFEGWYADKGLTKKITSVKLDANTTVYAKWTEAPVSGLPFGDVKSADWFYNDVKYVYEKGMMAGTAADVFAPNATTTRAMIVTILYRLEGSPAVTGTSAFVDVPAGQWYTDAVNWAAANQIVKGTSATTFAPNDSITREQMAAILYRYAQYKGYDVTKKADLSGYSDNSQVSAYAKDALAWANAAKLINGVTNTTLAPQGNATRAQVSAILHRFCDGVVK